MLVWPSTLPKPNRDGWQRQLQDARADRVSSAGPVLPRLNHSMIIRNVSLAMEMSRSQKAVFDRFLERDTRLGALPFLMPDPTTHGWPVLLSDGRRMLLPDGRPVLLAARRRCYFGKPMPVETIPPNSNRFIISFSLVVLP